MQKAQQARGWYFLPKLTFVLTMGLITAATGFKASATDVFTDPVGFITLTAEGTTGPGVSPANSFLGLGMTPIPALRGVVGTVSGTQVGTGSTLTPGQYNAISVGAQYYIEVTSGALAGFTDDIVSNDAANVYTANNDSTLIASGVTFKVLPHWTLASVFGPADQSGLNPGSPSTADQVLVQNPVTKTFSTYFFATASKTLSATWKSTATGNTDASLTPLYEDQGIIISRQVSTNLAVALVGAVKIGPTLLPLIGPGNSFAANVYATSAIALSNSALYTDGVSTDSLVAGSPSTADQILIHNDATGVFSTYFYATASKTLSAGWKSTATGNTDASGTSIPLGANIIIVLQTGHTGFNWAEPAPY